MTYYFNFDLIYKTLRDSDHSLSEIRKFRVLVPVNQYSSLTDLFDFLRLNYIISSVTDSFGVTLVEAYDFEDIVSFLDSLGFDFRDFLLEDSE